MSHSSLSLEAGAPARGRRQNTSLGSKLSSVFNESFASVLGNPKRRNRDQSRRSRSQFQSSGRGGAGNIRSFSVPSGRANRSNRSIGLSKTTGRELRVPLVPGKVTSTGRGGTGNIHSSSSKAVDHPTREALSTSEARQAEYEYWVIRVNNAANKAKPRSSGRGGAGNIVRSDHQPEEYTVSMPPGPSHDRNESFSISSAHTTERAPPSEERLQIAPWEAHGHSKTTGANTIEKAPPSEERLRITPRKAHGHSKTAGANTIEKAPPSEERLRITPRKAHWHSKSSSANTIESAPPSEERLRIAPWEAHWHSKTPNANTVKRAPPSEEKLRKAPWKAHWHSKSSSASTIERVPPSEERLRIAPWEAHCHSGSPSTSTIEGAPPSEERLRIAPWEAHWYSSQ